MKIEENQRKHKKQMGFCNYLVLLKIILMLLVIFCIFNRKVI